MKQSLCDKLDDYMLGWLSADEAAAFERHLADCAACRQEIALQKSIDGLLAKAGEQLEAVPVGLIDRAKSRVKKSRRRKALLWIMGLSATAALVLFSVFNRSIFHTGDANNQGLSLANNPTAIPKKDLPPPFRGPEPPTVSTRVKLADPSSGIVLECKTKNPKISIVCIYPTVQSVAK